MNTDDDYMQCFNDLISNNIAQNNDIVRHNNSSPCATAITQYNNDDITQNNNIIRHNNDDIIRNNNQCTATIAEQNNYWSSIETDVLKYVYCPCYGCELLKYSLMYASVSTEISITGNLFLCNKCSVKTNKLPKIPKNKEEFETDCKNRCVNSEKIKMGSYAWEYYEMCDKKIN